MKRFAILLLVFSVCCVKVNAQYMTSRSIIKVKNVQKSQKNEEEKQRKEAERIAAEEAAKAEAERQAAEQARIAAEKEAEAKRRAEGQDRIESQKEKERIERERLPKIEPEKRRKLYAEKQRGFASMINLSYSMALGGVSNHSNVGATYTAGYRFNNIFYLGAGVGVNWNFNYGGYSYPSDNFRSLTLNPHAISIPIFAYFRANLLNRRCSPFVALAAGGNLSPKQTLRLNLLDVKYKTSGLFANPQVGLNFRTSTKTSIYLAVGFNGKTCLNLLRWTQYNATVKPGFQYGVDINIGVSF